MRKFLNKLTFYITLAAILFVPLTAWAVGPADVSAMVSRDSVAPGEVFTVTFTFRSEKAIGSLQAALTYDPALLEFQSGGNAVEMSGGTGGISDNGSAETKTMSYRLKFKALKAGTAKIAITESEITGYDGGRTIGTPAASAVVSIKVPVTPAPTQTPAPTEGPVRISREGQTLYIQRDLAGAELPSGFEAVSSTYQGESVQIARGLIKDLDLLYIRDSSGDASFYIYDENTDDLYPYVNIDVDAAYTLLKPQGMPQGCRKTSFILDGKSIPAWTSDAFGQDFYLVYAMNGQGQRGYYLYDTVEGTLQRMDTVEQDIPVNASAGQASQTYLKTITGNPDIFIAAISLIVLCMALIVGLVLVARRGESRRSALRSRHSQ